MWYTGAMKRLTLLFLALLPALAPAASPVWFNSGMNNRDITFSPDGNVLLTTIVAPKQQAAVIAVSVRRNGQWSPLEVAPFSGSHMDIEPAFSVDGDYLYFASRRPKPYRDEVDWDLWRVSFDGSAWGEPEHLGNTVNTPGDEFYPSLTADGVLYFTATREDTLGREDLYRAPPDEAGAFTTVENVGAPVNTDAYEFNAFIAPDESYLIFGAQRRPGEIGGGDLYISYRENGQFTAPVLLPDTINSARLDYCPTVFEGRLYFTTELSDDISVSSMADMQGLYRSPGNGLGDIYWVEASGIID